MEIKNEMKINFFLIFFFSILLIFPVFVSAGEDCIFDKYIEVSGDFVNTDDCITEDITAKEKTNIIIRTRHTGISISPLPIDGKYLTMDFKAISKDPLIYKLNQSNDTAHYAFQLLVQGVNFWLFEVFYISSKEWDLKYGNKPQPTVEKCGDKICNLDENCQNCTIDCGKCPPTTSPRVTQSQEKVTTETTSFSNTCNFRGINFGTINCIYGNQSNQRDINFYIIFYSKVVVTLLSLGIVFHFVWKKIRKRFKSKKQKPKS